MNIIKKLILIVLTIIIVSILAIFLINSHNDTKKEDEVIIEEEPDGYIHEMQPVKDVNMFFTVANCIQKYIDNATKTINIDQNNNIIDEETKNKIIYSLLSEEYISKNQINVNNVTKYIETMENYSIFIPIKMKCIYEENTTNFIVYGLVQKAETSKIVAERYYIVTTDNINSSFAIEPILNSKCQSIEDVPTDKFVDNVEINKYNYFLIETINVENLLIKYMAFYKNIMLNFSELSSKYFNQEYFEKRFGNINNYQQFINNNTEEIQKIKLNKYLINTYEDYTEYVCKDQYENLYIFKETAPMEFTVTLDTYTLPNEKFSETYKAADENMKVMMNIDKWRQMLNNRDYNAAYNVLDETFKQNNFGSMEKFEEYMREKLPLHYKIDFGKFSNQGQNYVQEITLTDITSEGTDLDSTTVTKTIIMKIDENSENFVMSFDI